MTANVLLALTVRAKEDLRIAGIRWRQLERKAKAAEERRRQTRLLARRTRKSAKAARRTAKLAMREMERAACQLGERREKLVKLEKKWARIAASSLSKTKAKKAKLAAKGKARIAVAPKARPIPTPRPNPARVVVKPPAAANKPMAVKPAAARSTPKLFTRTAPIVNKVPPVANVIVEPVAAKTEGSPGATLGQ